MTASLSGGISINIICKTDDILFVEKRRFSQII